MIDGIALQAAIDPDLDLSVPSRVFAGMLSEAVVLPNSSDDTAASLRDPVAAPRDAHRA